MNTLTNIGAHRRSTEINDTEFNKADEIELELGFRVIQEIDIPNVSSSMESLLFPTCGCPDCRTDEGCRYYGSSDD